MASTMNKEASEDVWEVEPNGPGEERLRRVAHPFLWRLYRYWSDLPRNGRRFPGRQDIDPIAIGATLPWVWLTDVVGNPIRLRHRLLGTAHVAAIGRDVTGEWVDHISPAFLDSPSYWDIVAVVERGVISYRRGMTVVALIQKGFERRERLALPLARDGHQVDMVLGMTVYENVARPHWASSPAT
jgi:hypothetical protein